MASYGFSTGSNLGLPHNDIGSIIRRCTWPAAYHRCFGQASSDSEYNHRSGCSGPYLKQTDEQVLNSNKLFTSTVSDSYIYTLLAALTSSGLDSELKLSAHLHPVMASTLTAVMPFTRVPVVNLRHYYRLHLVNIFGMLVSHALAWAGINGLAMLIYIPLNLRHARAWDIQ